MSVYFINVLQYKILVVLQRFLELPVDASLSVSSRSIIKKSEVQYQNATL